MTIKLMIFDFDGVLVDSEYIACQMTFKLLTEYGIKTSLDAVLHRFVGMHDTKMRALLATDVGDENVDEFLKKAQQMSYEAYVKQLVPMAGSIEMLKQIKLPKCIASNSRHKSLISKLAITKLDQYFASDRLYVGSMVAHPKPAPDLYLYAAKLHNVAPSECLVIEDSVLGINAAVAAKMPVIGYYGASHCYPGYEQKLLDAGANIVFKNLIDLPNIISDYQ